jgi:hypothetical protein
MKKVKVVSKEKVLVKSEQGSPANLIKLAISGGADLEKLEKLLTLQERWEANEARKIFASSFAIAQENIAVVIKTKLNPQTHSKYADLGDIIESAKPIYTKRGFSVIFYEGDTSAPESIRICADVLHTAGHKETYRYDIPLDGVGIKGNANMTKIHAKASSVSYGRRYLMCMIWNIPTQDDDGNAGNGKPMVSMPKPKIEVLIPEKEKISEETKERFVKAKELLGENDFNTILIENGIDGVEDINSEKEALEILTLMAKKLKAKNAK